MLRASNLCMYYDDTVILKDLNFTVAPGEIFCFLGQSGVGKTSIINIFSGVIKQISGKALVDNIPAYKKSTRELITNVTEKISFYGHLSGLENLDYFSRLDGFIYTKEGLRSLLKKVYLSEDLYNERLVSYTKVMRQKLHIALALSKKVSYILMDEPTSKLNTESTLELTGIYKKLSASGIGILMTSSDINDAINISSKIGVVKEGTITQIFNTSKISSKEIQDFF